MRLIRVFALERLPKTLQFKNQRGALQAYRIAVRFTLPAPRLGLIMMMCAGSHD